MLRVRFDPLRSLVLVTARVAPSALEQQRQSGGHRLRTDYTPQAVQFRYGACGAVSALLDRGEALGQVEALPEQVQRRLTKEEGA